MRMSCIAARRMRGGCILQERLAAQSAIMAEKEAALQESEGLRTHLEANAAVQHHQQQVTIARLQDSEACTAAKVHCTLMLCA